MEHVGTGICPPEASVQATQFGFWHDDVRCAMAARSAAVSVSISISLTTNFFSLVDFCFSTTEPGSGVAQLPHALFRIKKSTLEMPQPEGAIFSLVVQNLNT